MTGVEILVHNLSHSDLVLDINNSKLTLQEKIVARPKFSHFRAITEAIYSHALKHNGNFDISEILPYSRERREHLPGPSVPIGFNFRATPVPIRGLSSLRFKQDGAARVIQSHHHNKKNNNNHNNHNNSSNSNCSSNSNSNGADDSSSGNGMDLEKFPESCYDMKHLLCLIEAAHFPLIGALLKKWLNNILERGHADTGVKKVLVLVSGRGTASDFDANMADNSTEFTAKLIELFVRRTYPSLELRLIHSHSNLFRYDENIVFVKRELVPVIDSYRSTLVDEVRHGIDL